MVSQDRISRLAHQIGERLQGASQAPEEVQKVVQQVVKRDPGRLELVSRGDVDIVMDALQRTRGRVEALEKQVAGLEEALDASAAVTDEDAEEVREAEVGSGSPEEDAGAGETGR